MIDYNNDNDNGTSIAICLLYDDDDKDFQEGYIALQGLKALKALEAYFL